MIRSISTFQQSANLRQLVTDQKAQLNRASMELATGLKRDVYAEPGAAPARSLHLRSQMEANDAYRVANETLATRMEVTSEALSDTRAIAGNFKNLLISGDMASMNRDTVKDAARAALEQVTDRMNATFNGENLFSGTATDQLSVRLEADGTVTYLGGGQNVTRRIDDDTVLELDIRADDPALVSIYDALTSVLNTDLDAMDADAFGAFQKATSESMANAEQQLVAIQAKFGDTQARLDRKIEQQQGMSQIYTDGILDIEGVTPEEAAVEVEAISNQLKSTFEVTARLSQMSFLNYIR